MIALFFIIFISHIEEFLNPLAFPILGDAL